MQDQQSTSSLIIQGQSYPLVITMGAFLEFKRLTGREASQITSDDLSDTITFIYCVARSSARREGYEWPYDSPEAMADMMTPDELSQVTLAL